MRSMLRAITGQQDPAAEVAAIAAEIEAEKRAAAEASAELDRLDEERRHAPDFDSARAVEEAIARARWQIEHAEAVMPELQRRLSVLKGQRQAAAIVKHHRAAERCYKKLRVAIDAAAAAQAEAMAAREAAAAELGEGLVQGKIPVVAFRGLLLPDLTNLWSAELDRAFSGPPPKPKPVPPPSPAQIEKSLDRYRQRFREGQRYEDGWMAGKLQDQLAAATGSASVAPLAAGDNPQPAPKPKRDPRRDTKVGEGERLVTIVRNGVDVAGFQAAIGDVLSVPIAVAEGLLRGGAADFVED